MTSIKVLGQKYKVKHVKGLIAKGVEGLCCCSTYTISIDASLKGHHYKRVFFHELAHAYAFEAGLGEFMERETMEMFAQTLSSMLVNMRRLKKRP